MRHTQLKAFDTVALEGGFSAAAERLGLTQPAFTKQVRALEEAYAISLFQRTSTKVTLTDPPQCPLLATSGNCDKPNLPVNPGQMEKIPNPITCRCFGVSA